MKKRLDIVLFERKLFNSREKAKEAIEEGIIYSNGKQLNKAGDKVEEDTPIEIKGEKLKYVSRAGLKIEYALDHFPVSVKDKVVMDVGASTGGFTDCVLQYGAKKVYAIDVGYNQLVDQLKSDPRVENHEKTNIKDVNAEDFKDVQIIVTDVSFISLTKISYKFAELLHPNDYLIALIKPQFELGATIIKKCKGVVKDEKLREEAKDNVIADMQLHNLKLIDIALSPIKGTEGNVEYIALFKKL
ncbi:MAG: TlyA family RNA methyltransferase [Eubacteriales bacterium]|nr:TlyA family RNA methyltransferase [Eubacteriales bacterium]